MTSLMTSGKSLLSFLKYVSTSSMAPFLADHLVQVTPCYPEDMKSFPRQISTLLLEKYAELDADTRKCLISNLIIMRKKDVLDPIE